MQTTNCCKPGYSSSVEHTKWMQLFQFNSNKQEKKTDWEPTNYLKGRQSKLDWTGTRTRDIWIKNTGKKKKKILVNTCFVNTCLVILILKGKLVKHNACALVTTASSPKENNIGQDSTKNG
jgi:hypothetical protein